MSDWYYGLDNEQKGPINESELKADLAAGKLPADTLVWKEGMDDWVPANQTAALSFRQPPIPAKIQPSATTAPAVASAPAVVAASPTVHNPESVTPVDLSSVVMGKPEALEVDASDAEKNKIYGILAYVPIPLPVWWLISLLAVKNSPFAKYHANQGLVLAIVWVALSVVLWIIDDVFSFLPSVLYTVFAILNLIFIAPLGLAILGIINAAAGKCVPLPLIGGVKLIK